MALLAIALPVYNDEKHIARTLESVLAQTFQNFELHIYDNCSTDHTNDIIRSYLQKDARIFLHKNTINVGMANNFNYCLRTAKYKNYKYVSIKSANDIIYPTYYEKCIAFLEKHSDFVLSYTEGTNIASGAQKMYSYEQENIWERIDAIVSTQGVGNMNYGVLRADVVDKLLPILTLQGSDHIFFLNLAILGKLRKIPQVLYEREAPTHRTEQSYENIVCSSLSQTWTSLPHHMNLLFGYIVFCHHGYLNGLSKEQLIEHIIDASLGVRYKLIVQQYKQLKHLLHKTSAEKLDYFMLYPRFITIRHFLLQNSRFRNTHLGDYIKDLLRI